MKLATFNLQVRAYDVQLQMSVDFESGSCNIDLHYRILLYYYLSNVLIMVKSLTYARWFLMQIGFMTISSGTASSSLMCSRTQSKISSPQPCAGAVIPSSRRACGFFLWDLVGNLNKLMNNHFAGVTYV